MDAYGVIGPWLFLLEILASGVSNRNRQAKITLAPNKQSSTNDAIPKTETRIFRHMSIDG